MPLRRLSDACGELTRTMTPYRLSYRLPNWRRSIRLRSLDRKTRLQMIPKAGLSGLRDLRFMGTMRFSGRSRLRHRSALKVWASQLTQDRLRWASRTQCLRRVYLLTTDASSYWRRHGFSEIRREEAPPSIRSTAQWNGGCSASAIAIKKQVLQMRDRVTSRRRETWPLGGFSRRQFVRLGAMSTLAAPAIGQDVVHEAGQPRRSYGERSSFEKAARYFNPGAYGGTGSARTPLQDLYGIITPSASVLRAVTCRASAIDPTQHQLLIDGLVDTPLLFSMKDIGRMPSVSRVHFVECAGNSGSEHAGEPRDTPQKEPWSCQLRRMDWGCLFPSLLNKVGVKAPSEVALCRRSRRLSPCTQHSFGKGNGRRHCRLWPKWRSLASGTRISPSTGGAWLGREYQHRVAAETRPCRPASDDEG